MQWPDDSIRSCLAPFASLLNHSCSAPHIVRYSCLDPTSCRLHFTLCRPCSAGQQCYLSYGPLPNLKLLLFYGMAVPANPQDVVNLQLQVSALSSGTWHLDVDDQTFQKACCVSLSGVQPALQASP